MRGLASAPEAYIKNGTIHIGGSSVTPASAEACVLLTTDQNVNGTKTLLKYGVGLVRQTITVRAPTDTEITNGTVWFQIYSKVNTNAACKMRIRGYSRHDSFEIVVGIGGSGSNAGIVQGYFLQRTNSNRRVIFANDGTNIKIYVNGFNSGSGYPITIEQIASDDYYRTSSDNPFPLSYNDTPITIPTTAGGFSNIYEFGDATVNTLYNQTIAGTKTFSNDMYLIRNTPVSVLRDTAQPYNSTVTHGRWELQEKNGHRLSMHRVETTKTDDTHWYTLSRLTAHTRNSSNTEISANMTIQAYNDGTTFATAPYRTYVKTNTSDIMTIAHLNSAIEIDGTKYFTGTITSPNHNLRNASLVQSANSSAGSMTLNFLGRNSANTGDISRAYIQFYHAPGNDSASSTNLLYLRAYKDNCTDFVDLSMDATNKYITTNGTMSVAGLRVSGQQVMQYYNNASNVTSIVTWGTLTSANGYTHVAGVHSAGGEFRIASSSANNGIVSAQLDGWFYQNEGRYRCIDTSDVSGLSVNYANSAGSVAWGNVSGKPAFVNNGTTDVVAPSGATWNGFFYVSSGTSALSGADANPLRQYHTSANDFRIWTNAHSANWLQQIATDFRTNEMYLRRRENGTWQDWVRMLNTANVRFGVVNSQDKALQISYGWTFRSVPYTYVIPITGTAYPFNGWGVYNNSTTGCTIINNAGTSTILGWYWIAIEPT